MLVKKKVSVGCDIEFVELLRYKYTIELAAPMSILACFHVVSQLFGVTMVIYEGLYNVWLIARVRVCPLEATVMMKKVIPSL